MRAVALARPRLRLTETLGPRGLLDCRRVLRHLRRDADALLVVLDVGGEVLDLVGDDAFLPRRLPSIDISVPTTGRVALQDGTEATVAITKVRLVAGWPSLGLHVLEPAEASVETVGALLEDAAEKLEDVIIAVL